jgi:hypothetical protein
VPAQGAIQVKGCGADRYAGKATIERTMDTPHAGFDNPLRHLIVDLACVRASTKNVVCTRTLVRQHAVHAWRRRLQGVWCAPKGRLVSFASFAVHVMMFFFTFHAMLAPARFSRPLSGLTRTANARCESHAAAGESHAAAHEPWSSSVAAHLLRESSARLPVLRFPSSSGSAAQRARRTAHR